MNRIQSLILIVVIPSFALGSDCPVSIPDMHDPAGTLNSSNSHGWYGTEVLAALIPKEGHWNGMGPARSYGDKFWWWRNGYDAHKESKPNLMVFAEKLNDPRIRASASEATSGFGDDWDAMLVGMEFPSAGCWRVTGTYNQQNLDMVLLVGVE